MIDDGRHHRRVILRGAALAGLLVSATDAAATVSPDQGDPPAPTVVVMGQGDLAALGPGARARAGDFRLDYGTVAFVVSQPGALGRREPGGALIEVVQLFPTARRLGLEGLAQRGVIYARATVSRSRDLATVQLEGYDSEEPQIEVRTQYQLGPVLQKSDALRVVTTLRNGGGRPLKGREIADTLRWGTLARFVPGAGLATPTERRPLSFLEGIGGAGTLLYLPGGSALGALGGGQAAGVHGPTWSEVGAAPVDLPAGGSATFSRVIQVTGDPSRVLCQGAGAIVGKAPLRGTVREEGGGPQPALVVLERPSGEAVAATAAAESGRFSLCAPAPGPYRLRAEAPGRASAPLPVKATGAPGPDVALVLPRPAHLHVSLREAGPGHGAARAGGGRLSITPLDGQAPRAVSAGSLTTFADGNLVRVAAPGGEADLILPPGRYRVVASRGPFYALAPQELALRPGETRKLALTLRRGVPAADTLAVRCASLRALPVGDAALAVGRAEGLDLLLGEGAGEGRTEPAVVVATEVASSKGRLVAYPLQAGTLVPELRQVPTAAAIAGALRRLAGEGGEPPLVQGGLGAPVDVVWAGSAPDPAVLRGWLARLDEGVALPAVAAADPRAELRGLGAARTCFSEAQSARSLSPGAHLRAALRRGDAILTNGPWLRVSANGAEPGELAAAPDGKVEVSITVLASSFVDVRDLELWVGARRVAALPVPPTGLPLRYRGTLRTTIDKDAAVVVMVRGNRPLDPLVPGAAPFALSNPVLVDRDGDGRFGKGAPRRPGGSKK